MFRYADKDKDKDRDKDKDKDRDRDKPRPFFFGSRSAGTTADEPNFAAMASSDLLSRVFLSRCRRSKRPSCSSWASSAEACTPVSRMGRGSTRESSRAAER